METYLDELIVRYPQLDICRSDLHAAFEMLSRCYEGDNVVYVCGNGGSAADADHIVAELMKSFAADRHVSTEMRNRLGDDYLAQNLEEGLRAVSLSGAGPLATAFANDVKPDLVFAQQVLGYGRHGDVLWALTTSGNSMNVVHALKVARARGMSTLGLTGEDGGIARGHCDVCIRVPERDTYKVQELHLPIYHALCRMLEAQFFGS